MLPARPSQPKLKKDGRARGASPFPVHLAAIDVGSNAVRFAAAEFTSPLDYRVLESTRVPVRLGHEVFLTGELGGRAMDSALDALRSFRETMETLSVSAWRAVATSAVREARNGPPFLRRAEEEAGIRLEAITGAEEARLVHLAVSHHVDLGVGPWLLADLGGGSVEVSLVDGGGTRWSESHTMGSVRLLEELTQAGEDPGRFVALLEEYASTLRVPRVTSDRPRGFIATGGNIETLAELAGAPKDDRGVAHLPIGSLMRLVELLSRMPYRKRIEDLGLRADRADVILPAAVIYQRLCLLSGADEVLVPGVGVREGILLDLVEGLAPIEAGRKREAQVRDAALALGRKYHFDEAHGRHVALLATSIFDQVEALHGLGDDSRRMLGAAALLHDVGSFIGITGHHKHSLYIIANSSLMGLSPSENLLVANVARYHRKGGPKRDHEHFMRLVKGDRERVLKLAAILRVADALDREHLQIVPSVRARDEGGRIRLTVPKGGDLLLERWSLGRKSDFFRRVYNREVALERSLRGGHP